MVFMEEMGRITGIKVCSHTHNEPGHGSDQCDSCGANCVRACVSWHLQHGVPIDHAIQTLIALNDATLKGSLKGMIHMCIEHDPKQKLLPSKVRMSCAVYKHVKTSLLNNILHIQIPDLPLGCRHCLHKVYKYLDGEDTASLFQHRFFNIGTGYVSTAAFLAEARCGDTYGNKTVKRTMDAKGLTATRAEGETRSVPDIKPVTGIQHAVTRERIRSKNEIKECRSEPFPLILNHQH